MKTIELLKVAFQLFINDIDSGNSNINESELEELLNVILKINTKELSKLESADYIGVCRATFDNYVNKGLIPKGHKRYGHPLSWNKYDLDKFKENNKKKKNEKVHR